MKYLSLTLIAVSALSSTACMTFRQPLASLSAVSMTHPNSGSAKSLAELGTVDTKYCPGEPPISTKSDRVGLMDEVTLRAQKEKNASFITDAQFFMEHNCIVLTGMARK